MLPNNVSEQVAAETQRLSAGSGNSTRQRLEKLAARPGTRVLAAEQDACIFRMEALIRDEYPEYQFFLAGQLIEVRRLNPLSDKYSFADFPPELEDKRQWIQDRFSALILTTSEGLGWFEPPWNQLNDEQQAMCRPKFIEDGLRYF